MAKNKLLNGLLWGIGVLTSLGVAGLFLNGTFETTFLGVLPSVVHQGVGWLSIVTTGWFAVKQFM